MEPAVSASERKKIMLWNKIASMLFTQEILPSLKKYLRTSYSDRWYITAVSKIEYSMGEKCIFIQYFLTASVME
jgi:hypothetical protein